MRLQRDFFGRESTLVAKELLGKVLVYKSPQGTFKGIINETEAYTQDEESCHAYNGRKTPRTKILFYEPGHFYVYFTYGMHYCCNIVTEENGRGAAVLIRSIIPLQNVEIMKENRNMLSLTNLTNGPAKLCQAFSINKELNGIDICRRESRIYIEDQGDIPVNILNTTRIGISKAKDLKWRFISKEFKKN